MPIPGTSARRTVIVAAVFTTVSAACSLIQAAGVAGKQLAAPPTGLQPINMPATPPLSAPTTAQIAAWIHALTGNNSVAQKYAAQHLIAAGDPATPLLTAAQSGATSKPVAKRLRYVLHAIALADALHGPLITLRSKSCTLLSLLNSVCASPGMWCQLPRNCKRLSEHFDVNIQRQLFWNVLLRIARATGISPSQGDPHSLLFSRHGLFSNGSRIAVNGAFAVVIKSASLKSAKQRTKSGQKGCDCQLNCNTLWVPTKKAFVQVGSPKVVSASEHGGHQFSASGGFFTPGYYGVPVGQIISGYPGTLNIGPIARTSHEIVRLVMNAPVAVSMNPEIQSANNLNSGRAEIDADGMRFLFGRPRPAKGQWGVTMTIITPPWLAKSLPVRAFLSRMNFFSPKPFVFTTADGNPIENPNVFGGAYVKPDQYEYVFPLTSKPAGVFVKTYARMVAVNVPFVFHHISIPLAKTSPLTSSIPQPPIKILERIKVRSQASTVIAARQLVMLSRLQQARISSAEMSAWIHTLVGQDRTARLMARRQLISAGVAAVPAIKKALNGLTTPRMRQEMRAVLAKIAQAETLRGPLVTLKLTNAPLRTILTQLCTQAGFSAEFVDIHLPIDARRLTMNVQRQAFWKVIQRIARLTGVVPAANNYWGTGSFTFYRPGAFYPSTPMYTHGSLLLAVQSSSVAQTLNFDAAPGHRTVGGFSLNIQGFWALGNTQIVQFGPVTFRRAVDNHGRSLLASKSASVMVPLPGAKYEFSFGPVLNWPFPDSSKIRDLQGELPITLAVAPRLRQVGSLNRGKAFIQDAGIQISIGKPTGVVKNVSDPRHDICTITISVKPGSNGTDSPVSNFFMQSLPQGTSFGYTPSIGGVLGFKSKSGRNLWCRVWKQAAGPGWNYKVYVHGGLPVTAWAKFYSHFIRVHVPFSFHNLPIPASSDTVAKPMAAPSQVPSHVLHPAELTMLASRGPAVSEKQISRWIRQLTQGPSATGQTAMRHLIAAGHAATGSIQRELARNRHPSVHRQLLAVLDAIAASTDLRGPLVSLNLKHVSVNQAVMQLCSKVGITAHYNQSLVWPRMTFNIRRQPFWQVLRRIADITNIGPIGNNYNNYRLQFGHPNLFAPGVPMVVHGACMLAIQSIRRYQNQWLTKVDPANKKRNFAATCFVLWAPTRKQILEQVGGWRAKEVITDAHGKVLLIAPVKASQNVWPHKRADALFPFQLHLPWPPPGSAALALHGTLRVYLSSNIQTMHLGNLKLGHIALTDDGMTLKFEKLQRIAGGWRICLDIGVIQGFSYHGKTSHWLAFAQTPIEHRFTNHLFGGKEFTLYDAAGHPLRITGHTGGVLTNRGWGYYRYTLNIVGAAPASATIKFFTRIVVVKVPFDFQNLPILR
ncbi:MAG: hypothetical protein ACP5VQ_08910 [Phycisphaerae bacterium]